MYMITATKREPIYPKVPTSRTYLRKVRLTRKRKPLKPRDQEAILLLISVAENLDNPGFRTALKSTIHAWIVEKGTDIGLFEKSGDENI